MDHCPSPSLVAQWWHGLAQIKKDIKVIELTLVSSDDLDGQTAGKSKSNGSKRMTEKKAHMYQKPVTMKWRQMGCDSLRRQGFFLYW